MRSETKIVVHCWSQAKGVEALPFEDLSEAWAFCADHPGDWIRVDKTETTVVFDRKDPLGLDVGPIEPITRKE